MKQRGTYLLVIVLLVIYLAKGIATVLPVIINTSDSVAWSMPDEYECEDNNQKSTAVEEDQESIYFDNGERVLIAVPTIKVTQHLLREFSIKYKSICTGPSTPPPELI